ncbi:MAG: glycosyltransferase, partial [Gemmatimonadaceae bacterium]|nr:glycosyltransferase [Acetobacteraceae bacterium]
MNERPPLLLHVFSSFAVGGVQARFASIVNHFGRRWRHAIVAMDGDLSCRERLDPGLDVTFPAVALAKGDTIGNVRRFRRMLRSVRPATLVTSNWGTIEWSMANLLPVARQVHIEDGFGPDDPGGALPRRGLTRRIVLRHQTVIVPSRLLWSIATRTWRINPARLRYVPNGIDLTRFAPGHRAAAEPLIVGTVAALRAEKDIARLLRAFALVGGTARLLVVGDGPERAAL